MHWDYLFEFEELAKRLNFSETARVLNMTQSNLSKHMVTLQKETGITLFRREKNRTVLTPAGGMFLNGISELVSNYEAIIEKCKTIQKTKISTISVQKPGLMNLAAQRLFRAASDYIKEDAFVRFKFKMVRQEGTSEALKAHTIDIGFVVEYTNSETREQRYKDNGWRAVRIASEPIVLWAKQGNKLLQLDHVTLADVAKHRIMTPVGVFYDYMAFALQEMFADQNLIFNADIRSGLVSSTEFFLSDPQSSVHLFTKTFAQDPMMAIRDDMQIREIDDPNAVVDVYFVMPEDETREEVLTFFKFLEEHYSC